MQHTGFLLPLRFLGVLLLFCVFGFRSDAQESGWTSNGPYGGYFNSFGFSRTDPNLVFASEFDAFFRSTDQGRTWNRVQIPGGEFTVRVHGRSPDVILAANYKDGVFQSEDKGQTWTQIYYYPFEEDSFYDFEFHPSNPAVLYSISYYHGVFKSTDRGRSWSPTNAGLPLTHVARCCADTPQLEIDPANPDTLYVLMPSRQLYKSTDAGRSWRSINIGLKLTHPVHALVIDPKDTRTLYTGGVNGIYRTTDGGMLWKSRHCECSVRSIGIDPSNPDLLYATGEAALLSRDQGTNWEWFTPHPFIASIFLTVAVHPANSNVVFVGGFGSGISRSEDRGKSWQTTNNRLDALNVVRMIAHPKAPGRLLAVAGQQVYLSIDEAKTWELPMKSRSSAFYFSDVAVHPANPKLIVAVGARNDKPGAVVISKDGGNNWEGGKQFHGVNYGCSRCVAFDPSNEKILYVAPFEKKKDGTATPLGIARTTDLGKSWKFLNNGLSTKDVWVIQVHSKKTENVYAGTSSGKIFVSSNGGQSWADRSAGLDGGSIRAITPDPGNPAVLFVATYNSIFKSADAGQSWNRKSAGLPEGWFNFIDVDPANPQNVYVTGQAGIFHSADGGESWKVFDSKGLGSFAVWNFLIDPVHRDTYYVGTDRGVFVYQLQKRSDVSAPR